MEESESRRTHLANKLQRIVERQYVLLLFYEFTIKPILQIIFIKYFKNYYLSSTKFSAGTSQLLQSYA